MAGFYIELSDTEWNTNDVIIANCCYGGVGISDGSKINLTNVFFINNSNSIDNYPSARRNVMCFESNNNSTLILNSVSNDNKDNSTESLWIKPDSCILSGVKDGFTSPFFVPNISNISIDNNNDSLETSIGIYGKDLIPCNLSFSLIVTDKESKESVVINCSVIYVNETYAMRSIVNSPVEIFDNSITSIVANYGNNNEEIFNTTHFEIIIPEYDGQFSKSKHSQRNIALLIIIILSVIIVILLFLICILLYYRKRKETQVEAIDIDMMEKVEDGNNISSSYKVSSVKVGDSNHSLMISSTDLSLDSLNREASNNENRFSSPGESSVSTFLTLPLYMEDDYKYDDEIMQLTGNQILEEAMLCESPYSSVIVDARDNLFDRIHRTELLHSNNNNKKIEGNKKENMYEKDDVTYENEDEEEKKESFESELSHMTVKERELISARTVFWIGRGIQHMLKNKSHSLILNKFISRQVLFGEDGNVLISLDEETLRKKLKGKSSLEWQRCTAPELLKSRKERKERKKKEGMEIHEEEGMMEEEEEDSIFEKEMIYSLGIILYEMMMTCIPYKDYNIEEALNKALEGERPPFNDDVIKRPLSKLILHCLMPNPEERPNFTMLEEELLKELPENEEFKEQNNLREDEKKITDKKDVERNIKERNNDERFADNILDIDNLNFSLTNLLKEDNLLNEVDNNDDDEIDEDLLDELDDNYDDKLKEELEESDENLENESDSNYDHHSKELNDEELKEEKDFDKGEVKKNENENECFKEEKKKL